MPRGLCHAVIDIIAYGRQHFDLHQWKDEPARELGRAHRLERHEWYKAFGIEWDFDDPSPATLARVIEHVGRLEGDERAERYMSWASHDYIDRVWDGLSDAKRRYLEGFFVWVLKQPEVLLTRFGADVLHGRVARVVDGREIWEGAPGLTEEYGRLRRYADAVVRQEPCLAQVVRRYGA